ncbi:hypothetical protein STRDD11_02521 [Streptococcus sp. DD11]|nr:hypothetical protein STRDD11_02521 [Streptococcus sp. DD11]
MAFFGRSKVRKAEEIHSGEEKYVQKILQKQYRPAGWS